MNANRHPIASLLLTALASLAVHSRACAQTPLTRAEVIAQYQEAMRTGDVPAPGGLRLESQRDRAGSLSEAGRRTIAHPRTGRRGTAGRDSPRRCAGAGRFGDEDQRDVPAALSGGGRCRKQDARRGAGRNAGSDPHGGHADARRFGTQAERGCTDAVCPAKGDPKSSRRGFLPLVALNGCGYGDCSRDWRAVTNAVSSGNA